MYKADCDQRFNILGIDVFRDVFHNDPRCSLIKLARKKDNFGECSQCSNFKTVLGNHRIPPEQRAEESRKYANHIALNAAERQKSVRRAAQSKIESHVDSIPPIIFITIAVSFIIDKMTKQTTGIPALKPMPKAVNSAHRLFVTLTGIIVHGVGFFCCLSTDAQSGGANLTIECIDRCLRFLQSQGYRFGPNFFVQGDNHTDNKTPAVLVYLANLVKIGIFCKAKLSMLIRGHGHADVDQKFAVLSKCIKKMASLVISSMRLDKALATAFLAASKKPTIINIDGVHNWSGHFGPAMAALDLGRLACSEDGGDSQHSYTFVPSNSTVLMTYKRFSSQQERYPRQYNVGDAISTETGDGQVTETEYLPAQRSWRSTVSLHNGFSTMITHPVIGIDVFPGSVFPGGSPPFERMAADWPKKVTGIEKNIRNCVLRIPYMFSLDETVLPEWEAWFVDMKQRTALCAAMGLAWYQGEERAELIVSGHLGLAVASALPCAEESHLFPVDPVTHVNFTAQQRLKAMNDSRSPPHLAPGVYVLLRLRHNQSGVPTSHALPCCIGVIPAGFTFASLPDGGVVRFSVMFTTAADLTGTWTATATAIEAPLSSILISGLTLTQARKVTAASQANIRRVVSPYEHSNSTPP